MSASRISRIVFRGTFQLRVLGVQQRRSINVSNVLLKRYLSAKAAPSGCTGDLDTLITNLVQESSVQSVEIDAASSVDNLKRICSQMNGPLNSDTCIKILSRFAKLANESGSVQRASEYLGRGLLTKMETCIKNEELSVNSTLEAMSALLILELSKESIFETLVDYLRRHFSSDMFSTPVSPIVRLAALLDSKKVRLPDDLFWQLREWLQLKASEITKPQDIVSVMIFWNKNDSWFNIFLEKAKCSISSMSSTELVGLMASLANNLNRPPHVLHLICSALQQKKENLMVNQLIVLAQSAAKLHFMDVKLRQLIADKVVQNISQITKWSEINAVVDSMAKLHIGDVQTWNVLSAWINSNRMNATVAELSYAVHRCAISGMGDSIQDAAELLCEKLTSSTIESPMIWLSSVYALAVCDRLTAELTETVLQPSFITNILEGQSGYRKLMKLTTLAQMQLFLKTSLNKAYQGPSVNIMDLMKLSPTVVNAMALKLRYGKSEEQNVEYFHSLLHKLIPVNSHAVPPCLTEDGIFVNGIVKYDVKANRFVPLNHFEETKTPSLAIIYLSWKDRTLTISDDNKGTLVGPLLLNLRLLKARGFIPVLFSCEDFDSSVALKQQFMFVKKKLKEGLNGSESI